MAQNAKEKVFANNVDSAIAAAAGALTYKDSYATFDKAIDAMKSRATFDPSLSQFVIGTVISFDPEKAKVGVSDIGDRGAAVVSLPAGVEKDNKLMFNRSMNVYLSSLDKVIRIHDANGEPVLRETGEQDFIDGTGNPIWEALRACKSDGEKLNWLKGKTLKVTAVKRGFGPANYVTVGQDRVPKGHRLTTLPLFEEI